METDFPWSDDQTLCFIQARAHLKVSCGETPDYVFQTIIDEIGLTGQVTPAQASKHWEFLVNRYKELSQPSLEPEDAAPPSWPFYGAMHDAMLTMPPSVLPITVEEEVDAEEEDEEEDCEGGGMEAAYEVEMQDSSDEYDLEEDIEDVEIVDEDDEDDDDDDDEMGDEDSNVSGGLTSGQVREGHNAEADKVWTEENTIKLIQLRGAKEADIVNRGPTPVFLEIIEELGLSESMTAAQARKKWTHLVRQYLEIKGSEEDGKSSADETALNEVWKYYLEMHTVMEAIKATSPDGGTKSRKSPEYIWSVDVTKKFIKIRGEKHTEISQKGHNAVYQDILERLGIADRVSVTMARKKWNYLVKRYQDEEMAGGERSWAFMKDMGQVMKHFRGTNVNKLKSRASPEFLWPNELTRKFISLRVSRHMDFQETGIQATYTEIMEELGLEHILNPNQLRKKWNYLVAKYKELSCTTGPDGKSPAPHAWPFYEDMRIVLQQMPENSMHGIQAARSNFEHIWTKEVTTRFIQLRGVRVPDNTKQVKTVFVNIIDELGLTGIITPNQARKKWNYLWSKYIDLSHPDVSEYTRQSWPYYATMQAVMGSLSMTQVLTKKGIADEVDEDEDSSKRIIKRMRQYTCFVCGKTGKILNDFFMYEHDQRLLYTQKTVLELISNLVSRKIVNMESNTCLCSACTNLVNEADSVIQRHDRIKEMVQGLYYSSVSMAKANEAPQPQPQQQQNKRTSQVYAEESESEEEREVKQEERITYSQRGRKRKATFLADDMEVKIKTEPSDDGLEFVDCDVDFDDDSEEERKRKKSRCRGRGRGRGRSRGRGRGRGRPAARSTLIGRGLGGQYPSSNKRKLIPYKGPKIYHCVECDSEFKKYTDLITHKKEVHTVIDNTPLEVEETILENGVITYFNKGKANNSETSHSCRDCDKQFLRKDDLWYHQEVTHTEGKGRAKTAFKDRTYACEECGETFLFKYKLKMHINSKHLNDAGQTANDFTCGECGCKLGSLPGLTFHMRKHHNKSLTYRKTTEYLCSDCGFMAPSNKKLREHQEAHCGSSTKPKVQCEICGKTVLKVSLKMHKVKMHSEFKEQCDRCGERYATKTDLLRHINVVHLRILLYNCQYCGERFPTSDALRYHRVKMHEKPTFYCQICGKCYKRVGELNTHIKRAHNDRRKAEVCSYCSKEYYDRSKLRNHLVSKHNVPQEMTYSENYLRKKRVDGLPLAKHMEKRTGGMEQKMAHMDQAGGGGGGGGGVVHQPQVPQQQQAQSQQQHPQQQHQGHHHGVVPQHQQQHPHMRPVVDEAAEAARNLGAYQEITTTEDDNSLVVTEITETPQVEQTVLVDPLAVPQGMMHHPQVAHMQPPMSMHHPSYQQMQHHAMSRLGVLYQMNMHHPGPSHLNM